MENLTDEADIRTILYPGTHDSGTYKLGGSPIDRFAKCQNLSIREQLEAGIRFIDIRVKYCPIFTKRMLFDG